MSTITKFFTAIAISSTLLFSCNDKGTNKDNTAGKDTFDMKSVRASIDSSNKAMGEAIAKGDSTAVAAFYTSDAKVLPANMESITSTDGIRSLWGGFIGFGYRLQLDAVDTWGNSDGVVEEGKYLLKDTTGKELDKGKYLVYWKQEGGKWKMFRDIWNSDVQPK